MWFRNLPKKAILPLNGFLMVWCWLLCLVLTRYSIIQIPLLQTAHAAVAVAVAEAVEVVVVADAEVVAGDVVVDFHEVESSY
jgi:hypothetical protein